MAHLPAANVFEEADRVPCSATASTPHHDEQSPVRLIL